MLPQFLIRQCLLFALFLSCWQSTNSVVADDYFNVIEKLHVNLLSRYNKQIRPVTNHTETLNVDVSLALVSYDFDEVQSRFSARGYFRSSWKDPRFVWSPSEYDGLETIHLPSEKVWTPDLEVYNTPGLLSKDRTFASSNTVLIFYNGTVIDVPLANLVSVCIPNPTAYPFDRVTCSVVMGSWTHNAYKIKFNPTNNETKVDLQGLASSRMSKWNLVDTNVEVNIKKYDCCPEPFENVILSFKIERSLSTFTAITTPTIVLSILTLATFLIPPAVGAKIIVGAINLALLCAYLLYFHATLPSGTANTPMIVSFYNQSLILVIISIVTSIISLRWIKLAKSVPLPIFIQKLLTSRIGLMMGAYKQGTAESKANELICEKKLEESIREYRDYEIQQMWTNLFLALDRVMMLVYTVIFALYLQCYLN